MDVTDFMSRFDADRLGLSEFIRGQLLEGDQDLKGLTTELYKLNVYGQFPSAPKYLFLIPCQKERTPSSSPIRIHLAV